MRNIKNMTDYFFFPLWDMDNYDNIKPGILPLSKELKQRLWAWSKKYDAILNMNEPALSGFITQDDEQKFLVEGLLLARDLNKELGDDFNIEY